MSLSFLIQTTYFYDYFFIILFIDGGDGETVHSRFAYNFLTIKISSNFLCVLILPISIECGGYVNGEGLVSSPNYLSFADDIDDCYWFVESRQSDGVVFLKRKKNPITEVLITTMRPMLPNLSLELPVMTVRY